MKKWAKRSIVWMALLGMCTLSGCASCARSCKSIQSDMDGGLNRTVTLYDYSGNEIKSWTGKFDVSESENEVYFDDGHWSGDVSGTKAKCIAWRPLPEPYCPERSEE